MQPPCCALFAWRYKANSPVAWHSEALGWGSAGTSDSVRDPTAGAVTGQREIRNERMGSFAAPTVLRSTHPVSALGRGPRGLRLVEEVQQLPLSELSEGCVGTLGSQRRIASKAALALGAGPELEQQPKLVLPVNGDAARGINLPDPAVYDDGGSYHTSHA